MRERPDDHGALMPPETDQEIIARLKQDNSRLRLLLDQRDAPSELRHRLRSTLGLLRAIVHKSAQTGRESPDYVAHLEDRLNAITHAQALADEHGEVDLRTLLADELLHYGASEGERLVMSGPDVKFQARAGQVLALAIHELAVNAVEHGCLGEKDGSVEVSWSVTATEPETSLTLAWAEVGALSGAAPAREGFGTEVLTRMLPYELKAESQLGPEPDGLRWTIRFPMPPQVGRIASE